MAVCSYYLRGTCKFGDNCRNEHPRGAFNNLAWTNQNRNGQTSLPFSTDSMTKDLTSRMDKPLWPLSSYGPAKGEPNLLAGLDLSPEELRVRAVSALRTSNANQYIAYESSKIASVEGVYANARTNIQQAHEAATKQSPVSSIATTNTSVFSKPTSAFGGQPTFGQSGFGTTPSAFGQSTPATRSAFGQPSISTTIGPFGQPVQPTSAFGTSTFGQTSQPQSSLIKPPSGAFSNFATGSSGFNSTGSGGFSAFAGKPTAFGQGATTTAGGVAFGQSTSGTPGGLTQQQPPPPPPQAQSAFGTFDAPTSQASSAFGASIQQAQPFGSSPITTPSTFRAMQPSPFSAFSSSFPTAATSGSSFAQLSQPNLSVFSTFASQQPLAFSGTSSSALGVQPTDTSTGKETASESLNFDGIIDVGIQCVTGMGKNTVLYKASSPYDGQLPADYAEIIPKEMIEAYKSRRFELGKVPEYMPPLGMR